MCQLELCRPHHRQSPDSSVQGFMQTGLWAVSVLYASALPLLLPSNMLLAGGLSSFTVGLFTAVMISMLYPCAQAALGRAHSALRCSSCPACHHASCWSHSHLADFQVAQQSLHEYQHHIGHASEDAVCDRCLQPIDQATYNLNVERLQVCQLCPLSAADWLWHILAG